MKKLLILLTLFIIPIAIAELQITPSSYDGSTYLGIEQKAEILLKNTFNFPIYNIAFTDIDYIVFPETDELLPNETIKFNITINTDTPFEKKTFNSIVKFWYFTDINLDSVTYPINITTDEFIPKDITIKTGDSLIFTNIGEIYASIQDNNSPYKYFNNIINVNQSVTISGFNTPDKIYYGDQNIIKKGSITVKNKSKELINNPDHNKPFTIGFDSKYTDSDITLDLYPSDNITMEYNEFQELIVTVSNTGSSEIHNVKLSVDKEDNWFEFEENEFDLNKDQNRLIDLRITPKINETEETNKTHIIKIRAESDNTPTTEIELIIFIPYAEEIQRIYYGSDFWDAKLDYELKLCREFPTHLDCNPPPKIEKIIEYRENPNETISFTKKESLDNSKKVNQRISTMEGLVEDSVKTTNTLVSTMSGISTILTNLSAEQQKANQRSEEAERDTESMKVNLLLIILTIIVVGFLGSIFYFHKKRKNRMKNERG